MSAELLPSCASCAWWESQGTAGLCRRHAPKPVLLDSTLPPPGVYYARWPVTLPQDFCGDYRPPPVSQTRES